MVGNGPGRQVQGTAKMATQLTDRGLDDRKEALRWQVREWEWRADKQRPRVAEATGCRAHAADWRSVYFLCILLARKNLHGNALLRFVGLLRFDLVLQS
jgi:hypothetical protein